MLVFSLVSLIASLLSLATERWHMRGHRVDPPPKEPPAPEPRRWPRRN